MRAVSSTYKQILASGNTRNYVVTINMTLADNTSLTITEEDIMQSSFKIMTASSGTDSFDIGSAIIGKCQFTLNNYDDSWTQYDFFDAEAVVWVGLVGDLDENENQIYTRMGFFTVDEPQRAGSLISLELLDNMWKFDQDLPTIAYPATIVDIISTICTHCGVILATQSFNGSSYTIQSAPEQEMNCREMLQYLAMIGCNFCVINDQGALAIKWYDTASYPSGGGTPSANIDNFTQLFQRTVGTDPIEITGVKFKIDDTDYLIGLDGYVLTLENPFVTTSNVQTILSMIWNRLDGFVLRTFNVTTLPDLAPEVGDCVGISYKNTMLYSYLTNNTFTPSLTTASLGAVTPTRTLTQRYSKAVQTAVEVARKKVNQEIGIYDLTAQRMNQLAINAMGGYTDYDDMPTGGRIYYLSNSPITHNAQTGYCEFPAVAVVYKTTGDGFFVSPSNSVDPQTGARIWTQGYTPSTGLLVNLLTALRINAEQMYTGTLTVGGSQIGVAKPNIRVLDASNNPICTIDYNGITMHKGVIQSSDYEYTSGHFSDDGTLFDITNDFLRSKYFAFDMNGAYINGQVEASSGKIGAATITQDAIKVIGNIELYSGSGVFQFRPTDYYFAEDFPLYLSTEGSCTVVLSDHINGSDYVIATYNVDSTEGVETVPLNHLIGTNPNDYYQVEVTGSPCVVSALNVILAYMGEEGFKGILEGVVRGYVDSDAGRLGHLSYSRASDYLKSDTDFNISVVDSQDNEGEIRITPTYLRYLNHYGDKVFFEHDNVKNNSKITREVSGRDSHVVWSDDMANEMFGQFAVQGIDIRLSQTPTGTINIDFNPPKYDTANDPYAADPTLPLADGAVVLIYE